MPAKVAIVEQTSDESAQTPAAQTPATKTPPNKGLMEREVMRVVNPLR